jgi:hypothetical protein
MTAETLERGYRRAYRDFYGWGSILKGAWTKERWGGRLRHIAYAGGWKKFDPLWGWVIQARHVSNFRPMLEAILKGFGPAEARAAYPGRCNAFPATQDAS